MKEINIKLEAKIMNDFRGHAGSNHKARLLIENWIKSYVNIENRKDQELLDSHRKSLTSE